MLFFYFNSAKDDAAGQAIANRMSSQITGLSQAQRNANDGISVAQTAEGALNQVNDNLQRIRELSVQAQNGTNSGDDLTSIQNEIDQRLNEINRISEQTSFNGVKVLASDDGLKIQVGANDGEAISVNLQEINAETLGLTGFNVDGAERTNDVASEADIMAQVGGRVAKAADGDAHDYVLTTENDKVTGSQLLSSLADGNSVTFNGNTPFGVAADSNTYTYDKDSGSFSYDVTFATSAGGIATIDDVVAPSEGTVNATYTLSTGNSIDITIDSEGTIKDATDGADLFVTATGELSRNNGAGSSAASVDTLTAAMDTADTTNAVLELEDGTKINGSGANGGVSIEATIKSADLVAAAEAAGSVITVGNALVAGTSTDVEIGGENDVTDGTDPLYQDGTATGGFAVTTDTEYTNDLYEQDDGSYNTAADGSGGTLKITAGDELTFEAKTTEGRTDNPLEALDSALKQVDSLRSDLGAIQNRFESAITNLQTNETNLSAARSRIEDADYAVEVANMTRAQILQQAGTSVLAQANQVPQNVLSLLG
ncbi:flagellin [Vreelandella aquamarina]|uniref:flagellin N-terminal helical domain-containing protein n=1 Tax=Vreelandella aquamarina TaxID=77097 RepID=UPI0023587E35|nr:flagellin [Halomonas aquamarina]